MEVEPKGLLTISHNMLNITSGRRERSVMCVSMFCFFIHCVTCSCSTGIPDCSVEDLSVAKALNLRWTTVLKSAEDGTQTLINSEEVRTVDDGVDKIQ